MESHGLSPDNLLDHVKVKTFMATDRIHALRQVILATRKGGRVSIPGVYGGMADKFPIGALMEKGLTIKSGQTHVQKFMPELLQMILDGKIDTTFLISHHLDLEDAADRLQEFQGEAERVHQGGAAAGTRHARRRALRKASRGSRQLPAIRRCWRRTGPPAPAACG
jgi:threonine dehydrogenase-like Zn-dependent dehydrogenase